MAAQSLAANGAKVYICGRTTEKLESAIRSHEPSQGGEIIPVQADISSKKGISSLVETIQSREKCICILVNNAGITNKPGPTQTSANAEEMKKNLFDTGDATFDSWDDVYRTNVSAVYFTTAAFLPLLQNSTDIHQGWSATVINISSISGLVKASQHHYAYNASKAATEHLTRILSAEVADSGLKIRINSIAPGVFPSEMTAGESDENQKSFLAKEKYEKVPARRPGKDEDMAATVLFAAANQYLNGQRIVVDGGYTLHAGM